MVFPFTISKLRLGKVIRELETVKGTAPSISQKVLYSSDFPIMVMLNYRHKKTATNTGCGFARLLEFLSSIEMRLLLFILESISHQKIEWNVHYWRISPVLTDWRARKNRRQCARY